MGGSRMEPTPHSPPVEGVALLFYSFLASLGRPDSADVSDKGGERKERSHVTLSSAENTESSHPPPTHHKILLTPTISASPGHEAGP